MNPISRRHFVVSTAGAASALLMEGCAGTGAGTRSSGKFLMYVGTYTGAKSKGIYAFRLDAHSGALEPLGLVAESRNPSFLATHPTGRFLYAVSESSDWNGKSGGYITAFSIDRASGRLTRLNEASTVGSGPCHLTVDKTGRVVLVANYGGGSVASLPLNTDGTVREAASFIQHHGSSVNASRQKEPHAHSFNISPDNRFAVAADLGLDKLLVYRLDAAAGTIQPNDPPSTSIRPGSGPRHFAFHPNGRFAYVINEIVCTMTALAYDAQRGVLTEIETVSTLPAGEAMKPEFSTAEVVVHPSGRTVYGSNRGHHTIAVFRCDPATGRLTLVQNQSTGGKTPRNFAVDPTGRWLFAENQDSDSVVQFAIDQASGKLKPTGKSYLVGAPVCIRFVAL